MHYYIGIIGGSVCSREIMEIARIVGAEVAKRKGVLICGGRSGVMEAASEGAGKEGGISIGILPGEKRSEGNPYLTYSIVTGMKEGRNIIIARSCDALIAIDGGYGTLSEIALGLRLGKPVVGIKTWKLHNEKLASNIEYVDNPLEAVEKAYQMLDVGIQ